MWSKQCLWLAEALCSEDGGTGKIVAATSVTRRMLLFIC